MFLRRSDKVEVTVRYGGRVVKKTFPLDERVSSQSSIVVSLEVTLPDRNPLHKDALNFDDLGPHMVVEFHNIYSRDHRSIAIIIGEPFQIGDKVGYDDHRANVWMVPVITMDEDRQLVLRNWSLPDMGIVPYQSPDGTSAWWNEQNYTLAMVSY